MDEKSRIQLLLKHLNLSANALSKELNLKNPQIFYDIKAGKCGISKDLSRRITDKYFNISQSWLLTGEGEMLCGDNNISQKVYGDNNNIAAGDIHMTQQEAGKLIETIGKQQETISELVKANQLQTNKFIEIIDRLTSK